MLHDLIERYNQQVSQVRPLVQKIVTQLDAASVPTEEVSEQLHQALTALQASYADIRSRAGELLEAGELPPQGAAVTAYQSAVEGSQRMQQIETLMRFGQVCTTQDRYRDALTKAQEQAKALLQQTATLTEDLVAPYAAVLQALSLGKAFHSDTPEVNAVLDELDKYNNHFDPRLMTGINRGAFELIGDASAPVETEASDLTDTEDQAPAEEAPALEADAEKANPAAEEPMQDENCAAAEALEQEEEMIPVVKPIGQRNALSVNKLNAKLPSVVEIAIIEALGVLHVVTPELIMGVGSYAFQSLANAAAVMETMENQGFLCSYEVDGERLYCCAPMLSACMNKNERYQFLNQSVHILHHDSKREWNKPILQIPVLVAQDVLPLKTLRYYRKQAELISAILQCQCDVEITVKWVQNDGCYLVTIKDDPSRLSAILPEDFLAAPPTDDRLLLTAGSTLPAADWMAACPAERRYFICGSCYVWDGTAWSPVWQKEESPADDGEDTPVAAVDAHTPADEEEPILRGEAISADAASEPSADDAVAEAAPEAIEAEEAPDEPVDLPNASAPVEEMASAPSEALPDAAEAHPEAADEPIAPVKENVLPAEESPEAEIQVDCERVLLPNGAPDYNALRCMVQSPAVPSDDTLASLVMALFAHQDSHEDADDDSVYNALLLAASAASNKEYTRCNQLANQLKMATGLLTEGNPWTGAGLDEAFTAGAEDSSLMLAAYAQALFTPATACDYWLWNAAQAKFLDYSSHFPTWPEFKQLFNLLLDVKNVGKYGFTPAVIALLGSSAENEDYTRQLCERARQCMDPAVTKAPTNTRGHQAGIVGVYKELFQPGSDLYECMEIIANNQIENFDFVSDVLQEYCTSETGTHQIDPDTINGRLEDAFSRHRKPIDDLRLHPELRRKAFTPLFDRVTITKEWVEHVDCKKSAPADLSGMKRLHSELLNEINSLLSQHDWQARTGGCLLRMMLRRMKARLQGTAAAMPFANLLHTGFIRQTDEGLPIIDASLNEVRFQEPWRVALQHILTPWRPLEAVVDEILGDLVDDPIGVRDNLHQLTLIGRYLGDVSERYQITPGQQREAQNDADGRMRDFRAKLELAYTYDRISESDKESLLQMMEHYHPIFCKNGDFACWHHFIDALTKQLDASAEVRRRQLRKRLSAMLCSHPEEELLKEAKRLLEEEMNFAVAEEYMNRVDSGVNGFGKDLHADLRDPDYFDDFISSAVFDPLYQECIRNAGSRPFRSFAPFYVKSHQPSDWTSKHIDSSQRLSDNWPVRRGSTSETSIQSLFIAIGFDVVSVAKDRHYSEEVFKLSVRPTPCSKADYPHPIAAFGTKLQSPLNVVVLYGNFTEHQLVDTVTALNLREMSIVLLDRPYTIPQRRLVGEIFHSTTGLSPFILIDQVLALYLSLQQQTQRMSAMLKCTLPFTIYNPFVHDGGPTADEMFFGRADELRDILNPNGACVVYGGRQLGKSALLVRAESLFSKPDERCFATTVNAYLCHSEEEFVAKVTEALDMHTGGRITFTACSTIAEFARQLEVMYRGNVFSKLLLLIDEADAFLDAISADNYRQLLPLVELRTNTRRDFKIVLAGLHNVCRALNAEKNNSIFAQLGTGLCVKPLSPTDAMQLLTRPLNYLGFRVDQIQHMETILTNTNYYPGILQFFGYKLVETMTTDYSRYYRAMSSNPPFFLEDAQLGFIMSSADLNSSIHSKFRLSLELDPRYYMIARCIVMLHHIYAEDGTALNWMGYSVTEIQEIAKEYDIHCLASADTRAYLILMDEMVSMGILSSTAKDRYRLRRSSFIDVIGRDMDVLEKEIIDNNKGAGA